MCNKKNFFFLLCFGLLSFISHAQILEKKTWLIGGSLSYSSVTQTSYYSSYGGTYYPSYPLNTYTTGSFFGSITAMNMITKVVALGAKATYYNVSGNDYGIFGPSLRIFIPNEKSSKVFLLSDVGFNTLPNTDTGYNVGLGLANFVSKNISIDIVGVYGNSFSKGNTTQISSGRIPLSSLSLQVGLQVYLPIKK